MSGNVRPTRKERRTRRVIEHRLRINASLNERKALFNEMESLTFKNLQKMLDGSFSPDDFLMDRECDECDYFRNTQLFQDQVDRYLNFIYAADAEYHDPDGVSELLAHIETTTVTNNENSEVLELVVNYEDKIVTISEENHHTVSEVQPLNLEFAEELSVLPVEMQYAVTDNLSCAEKIIISAHTGVAVRPCTPQNTQVYRLDQRQNKIINYCTGVNDNKMDIHCSPSPNGMCDHTPTEYVPKTITYSINGHEVSETILDIKRSPPCNAITSKWADSPKYKAFYSRVPLKDKANGCLCQSHLFNRPELIFRRSFVIGLAHAGFFPPRKRHLCVLGKVGFSPG